MLELLLVLIIAAIVLAVLPRILPLDAQVWLVIRVLVIIVLLVYAFQVLTGRRLF